MSDICTYTGRKVNLIQTEDMDIDFLDIAHALSLNCRFNGHTSIMWSVASHSILVSDMLYKEYQDPKLALIGLMHDASECYISDISRPLKSVLASYMPIEAQIQNRIYKEIGVMGSMQDTTVQQRLRDADDLALKTEALKMMIPFKEWEEELNIGKEKAEPWFGRIKPENPQIVKGMFLLKLFAYMRAVDRGSKFVGEYSGVMEEAIRIKAIPIYEGKEFFGYLEYADSEYSIKREGKRIEFPKSLLDNSLSVSAIW